MLPRLSAVILLSAALVTAAVQAATLRLRDGEVLEGEVHLDGDAVRLSPPAGSPPGGITLSYPLSDVAAITLKPPLTGTLSGGTLPGDWAVADVGPVGMAGSADYADGTFTLRGEGSQFGAGDNAEAFHYVYQRLPTDGMLIARIPAFPADPTAIRDSDDHAKVGLMIRQNPGTADRYAAIAYSPQGGVSFYARPNADLCSIVKQMPGKAALRPPCWLKIIKIGQRIAGAQSVDGKKWEQVGEFPLEGLRDACIGMFVTSNRADQLATAQFDKVRTQIHGIRAQYFGGRRFDDPRVTRIDPAIEFNWVNMPPDRSMPASDYCVRWTGLVNPSADDAFLFNVDCEGGAARLWVNGVRIMPNQTVKLMADKPCQVQVDYYHDHGLARCRLMWSTSAQPEPQPIPNDAYIYVPDVPAPRAPGPMALDAGAAATLSARGVLLADGSFLPGSPLAADRKTLTITRTSNRRVELPLASVAHVYFRPLPPEIAAKLPRAPGFTGLLTVGGDFNEGECTALADGQLTLNSLVFGPTSFDTATHAAAAVYRAPEPAGRWIVHTVSGGTLRASALRTGDAGVVMIDEPLLGVVPLKWSEITDISAVLDAGKR